MSRPLKIERYHQSEREGWDRVVSSARARHFMFERAYMDYHADRIVDASLFVLIGDDPVAVLPASRHGTNIVSHGGLTFGGLLSGPELTTARAVAAIDAIADSLRSDGAHRLLYSPAPHVYHRSPAEEDLYAISVAGAQLTRREVSSAVAAGSRQRYTSERKRALARGRKAGLRVAEDPRIEEYMLLVGRVLRARHGVQPVHTPSEMRTLADRFPGRIRLFTATLDEEILGGVLVYETPTVAHAQYIAAGECGRALGATDVVFDWLLTDAYADRWFDFGISNERSGELNDGLIRNKEGFGARAVVHDRYLLQLR